MEIIQHNGLYCTFDEILSNLIYMLMIMIYQETHQRGCEAANHEASQGEGGGQEEHDTKT